jgi:hypothetical protein
MTKDENKDIAYRRSVDGFLYVYLYRHTECLKESDARYQQILIDDVPSNTRCEQCGLPMKTKKEWYLQR